MRHEFKSLGFATALIAANILLMGIIRFTPLAGVLEIVFEYLILGVLFFGALITGGVYLAKRGIKNRDLTIAGIGVLILQLAYGMFGGGILTWISADSIPLALGITFVITTLIAIIAGLLVYMTGRDFRKWGMYANYIFLGVLVIAFIGTFAPILSLLAFVMVLVGFFVYLVYEIWNMKEQRAGPYLNGIGIYVAFMGVFVEILQLVVRMLMEE